MFSPSRSQTTAATASSWGPLSPTWPPTTNPLTAWSTWSPASNPRAAKPPHMHHFTSSSWTPRQDGGMRTSDWDDEIQHGVQPQIPLQPDTPTGGIVSSRHIASTSNLPPPPRRRNSRGKHLRGTLRALRAALDSYFWTRNNANIIFSLGGTPRIASTREQARRRSSSHLERARSYRARATAQILEIIGHPTSEFAHTGHGAVYLHTGRADRINPAVASMEFLSYVPTDLQWFFRGDASRSTTHSNLGRRPGRHPMSSPSVEDGVLGTITSSGAANVTVYRDSVDHASVSRRSVHAVRGGRGANHTQNNGRCPSLWRCCLCNYLNADINRWSLCEQPGYCGHARCPDCADDSSINAPINFGVYEIGRRVPNTNGSNNRPRRQSNPFSSDTPAIIDGEMSPRTTITVLPGYPARYFHHTPTSFASRQRGRDRWQSINSSTRRDLGVDPYPTFRDSAFTNATAIRHRRESAPRGLNLSNTSLAAITAMNLPRPQQQNFVSRAQPWQHEEDYAFGGDSTHRTFGNLVGPRSIDHDEDDSRASEQVLREQLEASYVQGALLVGENLVALRDIEQQLAAARTLLANSQARLEEARSRRQAFDQNRSLRHHTDSITALPQSLPPRQHPEPSAWPPSNPNLAESDIDLRMLLTALNQRPESQSNAISEARLQRRRHLSNAPSSPASPTMPNLLPFRSPMSPTMANGVQSTAATASMRGTGVAGQQQMGNLMSRARRTRGALRESRIRDIAEDLEPWRQRLRGTSPRARQMRTSASSDQSLQEHVDQHRSNNHPARNLLQTAIPRAWTNGRPLVDSGDGFSSMIAQQNSGSIPRHMTFPPPHTPSEPSAYANGPPQQSVPSSDHEDSDRDSDMEDVSGQSRGPPTELTFDFTLPIRVAVSLASRQTNYPQSLWVQALLTVINPREEEDPGVTRMGGGESYRPGGGEPYRPGARARSPPRADLFRDRGRDRSPRRERARTPPTDSWHPGDRDRSPRRRSRTPPRRDRSPLRDNWRARPRSPIRARSPPRRFSPRRDDGRRQRSPVRRDERRRSRSPYNRDRDTPRARSPLPRRSPPAGPRASYRARSRSLERREDRAPTGLNSANWRRRSPSPPARDSGRTSERTSGTDSRRSSPPIHPDRLHLTQTAARDSRPHSPAPQKQSAYRDRDSARSTPREHSPARPIPQRSPPRGPAGFRAPPTGPSGGRNFMPSPSTSSSHSISVHNKSENSGPIIPPSGPRGYVPSARGAYGIRGGRGSFGNINRPDTSTWGAAPPARPVVAAPARDVSMTLRPSPTLPASVPSGPAASVPTGPSGGIPTGPRAGVPSRPSIQHASSGYRGPNTALSNNSGPRPHPAMANLPQIIPGGRIDPTASGIPSDIAARLKRKEEEAELLREELHTKQEKLRQGLKGWDKLERDSRAMGLRSELSERHVRMLAGEGVGGAAF